jgi:hypothetical protein
LQQQFCKFNFCLVASNQYKGQSLLGKFLYVGFMEIETYMDGVGVIAQGISMEAAEQLMQ